MRFPRFIERLGAVIGDYLAPQDKKRIEYDGKQDGARIENAVLIDMDGRGRDGLEGYVLPDKYGYILVHNHPLKKHSEGEGVGVVEIEGRRVFVEEVESKLKKVLSDAEKSRKPRPTRLRA